MCDSDRILQLSQDGLVSIMHFNSFSVINLVCFSNTTAI